MENTWVRWNTQGLLENNGSGGIHRVWSVKNTWSGGKQWVRWNTQGLVSEKHRVWWKTMGQVEYTGSGE